MTKLTTDELRIARTLLNRGFTFLARHGNGRLLAYEKRPRKKDGNSLACDSSIISWSTHDSYVVEVADKYSFGMVSSDDTYATDINDLLQSK